ncbi:MAG: CDP-glycerol glycerophosphotransferase (TagB/SpsB family) [Rhodothermales bacterium]
MGRLQRALHLLRLQLARRMCGNRCKVTFYFSQSMQVAFATDLLLLLLDDVQFQVIIYATDVSALPQFMRQRALCFEHDYWIPKLPTDIVITPATEADWPKHASAKLVHLLHSTVSTHVVYREGVFDQFDFIFCVGQRHVDELSSMQAKRGYKRCVLVPAGYEIIDALLREPTPPPGDRISVLYGPTWGKSSSAPQHGVSLIGKLLETCEVVFRPHPLILRYDRPTIDAILDAHGKHPHFSMDDNISSKPSLMAADVFISDWSGVAFEYALARRRPVIFIDGEAKVDNPNWNQYFPEAGLESVFRERIGTVISDVANIAELVAAMNDTADEWEARIEAVESDLLFARGQAGETNFAAITTIAEDRLLDDWIVVKPRPKA